MRQITTDQLTGLLADHAPPCISLYQPTHRNHPENQQDPIRYRNLLTEMENSLRQKYPTREVRTLLEKFQALAHDDDFWNHRADGLAILSAADTFQVFDLQRSVPELLVVADSFHTKPLLRVLQSADRYQLLALNRHEAKLYEGNRYALDPVELTNVPSTITAALGEELTEQHMTVASYGAGAARAAGGRTTPSIHSHGDKKDEVDIDRDRFFRSVDRGILEHHSRPSGLPLVLAALTEHHAEFRRVSRNPFLQPDGVAKDPGSLTADQLRAEAWKVVLPAYERRLAGLTDDFHTASARGLAASEVEEAARAVAAGRVGTLLVEADRQISGRLDRATGAVRPGELADPGVDDLLDDLAEAALAKGGSVVVVPRAAMPTATGLAAVYRF